MAVQVAVIYYSATGAVHALAQAVAQGAASAGPGAAATGCRAGARQRDRPESAVAAAPDATASITQASVEDLAWADAFAFGTPTRSGAPAAQLKQSIDQADGLRREGGPADKPVTAFTSALNRHGGARPRSCRWRTSSTTGER